MSEKFTTALYLCTAHMYTVLIATYYPTDSTLALAYEHIITQNKHNTTITKLNVVIKNIVGTNENNTYNFEEQIAYLCTITSWITGYLVCKIWLKRYCDIYCNITLFVPKKICLILPFNALDICQLVWLEKKHPVWSCRYTAKLTKTRQQHGLESW